MALYSDINQTTPETTPLLFDLAAVKQSISNIILAFDGTRLFRPELNSHMADMLHEPFDELTEFQLKTELTTAIETFEPRVIVNELVIEDYPDEGRYEVFIHFVVRGLEGSQYEQIDITG
jgi:phage baseplate assembly protein W